MKLTYKQKELLKIVLFYIFIVTIILFALKEAMWERKLDIEYKQAIIELKEREDLNYERSR